MAFKRKKTIHFKFGDKHKAYIRACADNTYNVAEGAIRAGKTVDNVFAFAYELKRTQDKIHLASGSTMANAKLNIGDANGFGLEHIFRGQCRWAKYKDNEALLIKGPDTCGKLRIVIFSGAAKADSFKKIRGNSYGMWIATEVNLHHDSFIKEAFNRTAAAHKRKFFWDLNPDHPKAPIYTDYIDKYRDKALAGELTGYNYEHFTIDDNATISPERIAEIKSQYDPASIWYQRDIIGRRMVAEGLIYGPIADDYVGGKNALKITAIPNDTAVVNIGVDFGGTKSDHAFCATAINRAYDRVTIIKAEKMTARDTDPNQLYEAIYQFIFAVVAKAGTVTAVYVDSAEQVLKRGLDKYLAGKGMAWLPVKNSIKMPINERIRLTNLLVARRSWGWMDGAEPLLDALSSAVWDPKKVTENERLDDGSSDIDSLDAYEYTIEPFAARLVKEG